MVFFAFTVFSWIEPTWAPDKHAKMVLLKELLSQIYLNLKFENLRENESFSKNIFGS